MYIHMVGEGRGKSQTSSEKAQLSHYGIGVLAVSAVWAGRFLLEPILGGASPLLAFTLAVTITAYFGGFWPGMFSAALASVAGLFFFEEFSFTSAELISLTMLLTVSFAISLVFERLRRAHRRASENEERFRLLVEGASLTSIFALDPRGRIESWNAGAERLTGYTSAEALGRQTNLFYPPEERDRSTAQRALDAAAESGAHRWEGWLVRSSGEQFWAEVATTALRSTDGSIRGYSQVTRDLTESKRVELAIAESEEAMRNLMESAAQGIIGVDRQGSIVLVNAMAEQLFGYSREEMRANSIEMLIPADLTKDHVRDRERYFEAPRNRPMGMGLPLRARRKDGSEFPAEISLSTVQTRTGQLAVSFITDISGRRAAEAERERLAREAADERARLRAVLEQMPVGVILAHNPGSPELVLHNREAERILLHQIEGPSVDKPFGARHADGRPYGLDEYPLVRALTRGETVQQEEMHYRRGDGELTVLSVSAAPIRDLNGEIVASVTTFTDISPQKSAELERDNMLGELSNLNRFLERSNEDLRQFAYAASHDLQEPLRMVTSYTQLLERRYGEAFDSEGRQFIDYAVTGANRIEGLLKGLREYWQVSELSAAEPVLTNCNDVLQRALQNVEGAAREAGAQVTHETLPVVLADETPLLQLFQNLLSNAIKYRHPDRTPSIHVRAVPGNNEWIFSVRDNGIGIDPRYANQVFGIFKRLNGYRYSGAGIGLSICQKIVQRFGGRIWVESDIGQGADFLFTLPANRPAPSHTTADQSILPAPVAGSQR